ncbi:MAG: chemotaxis protein CheV [Lachnospiraceae bacterium]|nr:chemotaxis protein CheV [Lachnospiraceae bacterium]
MIKTDNAKSNVMETAINEFELLEFRIGKNCYGINVSKIKEILPYKAVTPIPNAHEFIEGIFMPRNMIITSVDLAKALRLRNYDYGNHDMAIVSKFNNITVSFHVEEVVGIHRVQWKDINRPDNTIDDEHSLATGIVRIDKRLIIILDLEKILSEINDDLGINSKNLEKFRTDKIFKQKILLVEDSSLILRELKECLEVSGYKNVELSSNGKQAMEILTSYKQKGKPNEFDCIITDIEMPIMDGRQFIATLKNDNMLKNIPIIVFSSIVDNDNLYDDTLVRADAMQGKPDIELVIKQLNDMFDNN